MSGLTDQRDTKPIEGENAEHSAADVSWLRKSPQGVLEVGFTDGSSVSGVTPVRAFPISEPQAGFSLVDAHGHEVLWVDSLSDLPRDVAFVFGEELQRRDFMPQIQRIVAVSSFITPCEWSVQTDRGDTRFTLKGEEDIRRLGSGALLITDRHGIHYLLNDPGRLDKASRKILDRFL